VNAHIMSCLIPVSEAAEVASGLLATGAWGGLWKGAAAGAAWTLLGFFSKPKETAFRGHYLVPAALAGAAAGLVVGLLGVPFDQPVGWLATVGGTEALYRAVKGTWRRWAGDKIGEAVARIALRGMPEPPERP